MTSIISKKTISEKAKLLQRKSSLNYTQSLQQVSKEHGFRNYNHFNNTKKFKIAIFSRKGGVGKTSISRSLFIDLNADRYYRTNYILSLTGNYFFKVLPTQEEYSESLPDERLSAIYDLCRYTKFEDIEETLRDIDLFILPTIAHETVGAYKEVIKQTVEEVSKYNKPIIILSYGWHRDSRRENKSLLENLKNDLSKYENIYCHYLHYSTIFNDKYVHSSLYPDNSVRFYSFLNEETMREKFYLDLNAKSILEIYNESLKNQYMFKSIYNEYIQFLKLVEDIIKMS